MSITTRRIPPSTALSSALRTDRRRGEIELSLQREDERVPEGLLSHVEEPPCSWVICQLLPSPPSLARSISGEANHSQARMMPMPAVAITAAVLS